MRRFITKFKKSFRYGEKGFTLIELLIVILILGVLAAAVVPNVARFMQTGQKGAAEAELGSVQVAVYAGMADNGVGTITGGDVDSTSGVIDTTADPDIDIDDYLQGGVGQLQGLWTVETDGLVSAGSFPDPTGVTIDYWVYAVDAAGVETWTWTEAAAA